MSLLDDLRKQKEQLQTTTGSGELIQSFHIPVEIPYNGGKVRMYIAVNAAQVQSQQDLEAVLKQLDDSFGIAVYRQQQQGFYSKSYNNRWQR